LSCRVRFSMIIVLTHCTSLRPPVFLQVVTSICFDSLNCDFFCLSPLPLTSFHPSIVVLPHCPCTHLLLLSLDFPALSYRLLAFGTATTYVKKKLLVLFNFFFLIRFCLFQVVCLILLYKLPISISSRP